MVRLHEPQIANGPVHDCCVFVTKRAIDGKSFHGIKGLFTVLEALVECDIPTCSLCCRLTLDWPWQG